MIYTLVINSLVIFGIYAITRENMLLYNLNRVFSRSIIRLFLKLYNDDPEKAAPKASFILKPLIDCPPCMASVWSIPFLIGQSLYLWPVYMLSLCGFNYIIMKLISKCK